MVCARGGVSYLGKEEGETTHSCSCVGDELSKDVRGRSKGCLGGGRVLSEGSSK